MFHELFRFSFQVELVTFKMHRAVLFWFFRLENTSQPNEKDLQSVSHQPDIKCEWATNVLQAISHLSPSLMSSSCFDFLPNDLSWLLKLDQFGKHRVFFNHKTSFALFTNNSPKQVLSISSAFTHTASWNFSRHYPARYTW